MVFTMDVSKVNSNFGSERLTVSFVIALTAGEKPSSAIVFISSLISDPSAGRMNAIEYGLSDSPSAPLKGIEII